uniref:RNase H type-1 domain-containing protein n=1 Tax=Nicotiana tabacum TaxID=4097 RepID=A0A1S3YME3_TOBAC|nr:PREDICTED: uncharacterized protein LOC107777689 [Nicotiana tabacum]
MERATEFCLLTEKSILPSPKIYINVKWHRLPKGWFKLNIDASFHKNIQICGLCGVIRNANGHWIVGYTKSAHARGSLHAEIKALLDGLKTSLNWGLLMLQQKQVIIQHEFRQGNKVAHQLAQMETADLRKKKKVFVDPPAEGPRICKEMSSEEGELPFAIAMFVPRSRRLSQNVHRERVP